MYVRIVKSGDYQYARLVESYRDSKSGKVKQRVLHNLFRIDDKTDAKIKAIQVFIDRYNDKKKPNALKSMDPIVSDQNSSQTTIQLELEDLIDK